MSQVLKSLTPKGFPTGLEHRVERGGKKYFAGVKDCVYARGSIWGDLYLDRLEIKPISEWSPEFLHPFRTVTREIEERVNEFYIRGVRLDRQSFGELVSEMNKELRSTHSKKISFDDAQAFFEQIYERYTEYHSRW